MKKITLVLSFLLYASISYATTYYVCDTGATCGAGWSTGNDANNTTQAQSKSTPWKTISHGISTMSAADTLVVGDGTYAGASNTINYQASNVQPKSGTSSSAYTVIKAENDGGATITYTSAYGIQIIGNENVDAGGFSPDSGPTSQHYIEIRGFVVNGSSAIVSGSKYIKFINVGSVEAFIGNNANIGVAFSEYILFEGCYAWGGGRYKFLSFHSHYSIFRNCVGRLDYVEMQSGENDPIATFSMYSSTNIEVQNCIDIDSDTEKWGSTGAYQIERPYGAFFNPSTSSTTYSGPIIWTNVITLNNKLGFGASDYNNYVVDARWRNAIGWAIVPTNHVNYSSTPVDIMHTQGSADMQQSTIGAVTVAGSPNYFWNGWKSGNTQTNKNNILVNISGATNALFYDIENNLYNNIYNSGGSPYSASGNEPTNTVTTNPLTSSCLKYLPRLETGCSLSTAGQSGARIGAEILYQYGKTGTLYGDTGYASLQDGTGGQTTTNIWPFPNESLIKTKFSSYNLHTVTGARGFATGTSIDGSTQTLTKYIWEYLGSQIPSNIYGSSPSDNIGSGKKVRVRR